METAALVFLNDQHEATSSIKLSIVVPVFNEVDSIGHVLESLLELDCEKEIVVIDDGSSDGSLKIAQEVASRSSLIQVFAHHCNQGKGAAVRSGIQHAVGEYIVVHDADLEYDPKELVQLLDEIQNKENTVVFGSRYLSGTNNRDYSTYRFGVWVLNVVVAAVYNVMLSDVMTCYKMAKLETVRDMELECRGFEFCTEFIAKSCKMGLVIVELPISYARRDCSQGKKLRVRDCIPVLKAIWRYRKWCPK